MHEHIDNIVSSNISYYLVVPGTDVGIALYRSVRRAALAVLLMILSRRIFARSLVEVK